MSRRLKNLLFAFGVSLSMWVGIIYASVTVYHAVTPSLDGMTTASVK